MLTRLRSGDGISIKRRQKAEEIVHLHVVRRIPAESPRTARCASAIEAMHCTTGLLMDLARDQLHVRGAIVFVDLFEALGLMILGVEDLDQAMRIDGFLRDPRDVAHRILNALAVAAKAAVGDSASARR